MFIIIIMWSIISKKNKDNIVKETINKVESAIDYWILYLQNRIAYYSTSRKVRKLQDINDFNKIKKTLLIVKSTVDAKYVFTPCYVDLDYNHASVSLKLKCGYSCDSKCTRELYSIEYINNKMRLYLFPPDKKEQFTKHLDFIKDNEVIYNLTTSMFIWIKKPSFENRDDMDHFVELRKNIYNAGIIGSATINVESKILGITVYLFLPYDLIEGTYIKKKFTIYDMLSQFGVKIIGETVHLKY